MSEPRDYHAYVVGLGGHVQSRRDLYCATDADVIERANNWSTAMTSSCGTEKEDSAVEAWRVRCGSLGLTNRSSAPLVQAKDAKTAASNMAAARRSRRSVTSPMGRAAPCREVRPGPI
jgi:hypothetical protein